MDEQNRTRNPKFSEVQRPNELMQGSAYLPASRFPAVYVAIKVPTSKSSTCGKFIFVRIGMQIIIAKKCILEVITERKSITSLSLETGASVVNCKLFLSLS
jgi:hypothetical protein